MPKIIQCVPNFSEGRRRDVVEKIVDAIASASGARVIDWSMDADHNRAVVTFIGAPQEIRASMLAGARAAVELIDLNEHTGGHPRIGAVDVIPIVPVDGVSMDEAVALSREIGSDIANELRVPVYFYENSAIKPEYCNLADVRRGGFEELKASNLVECREPDLGPRELHPTAGATAVGARGPLIAYNVNLATHDIHIARKIASKIRNMRDSGEGMAGVKAIAVLLKSRDIAQVSTNLTKPHLTGLWDVFSFIEREAREIGIEVLESELIGALRERDLINADIPAMKFIDLSEKRVIDWWISSL
ncbi:MAG: glutamate formimidoyltransferase [Armatimonadetes bacterium]|nr:glutamate formimidoyltransferase [Armatimonadota bacterium]